MSGPGLKFPAVIKVLGQEFTVQFVGRDDSLFRGAGHDAIGSTDLNLQKIKIRGPEEISAHQAVDTLLHETLHAIFRLFSLGGYLEADHDEDLIMALAPALLHTLRDNPLLVEAIMSADLAQPQAGELVAHGHED